MNEDVLKAAQIQALLSGVAEKIKVVCVEKTESTNADLLAMLPQNKLPQAVIAEIQTKGRGREGRTWWSEKGNSITFSLAWPFAQAIDSLRGLSLVIGVAIVRALLKWGVQVQLKWPNDVLKEGKKLAGVLIETRYVEKQKLLWAVIGVGMNLFVSDQLEETIGHAVADAPWLGQLDRTTLIGELLNQMACVLALFERQGFTAFQQEWNQAHAYHEKWVKIIDQGHVVMEGVAKGVDQEGYLLLEAENEKIRVQVGHVSLREG
jgi:BirA family biotin operon repressor/biotin-[acetyl-CoA-carboxylase] ligase